MAKDLVGIKRVNAIQQPWWWAPVNGRIEGGVCFGVVPCPLIVERRQAFVAVLLRRPIHPLDGHSANLGMRCGEPWSQISAVLRSHFFHLRTSFSFLLAHPAKRQMLSAVFALKP